MLTSIALLLILALPIASVKKLHLQILCIAITVGIIVDGTVDVAICVSPSDQQLAYAEKKGVELEFVPIGREALKRIQIPTFPCSSTGCSRRRDSTSLKKQDM